MDGKLQNLESYLKGRVIGQEDAIARVSRAIEAAEYDLNDRGPRPKGSFLFMGSRGIGKCLGKGAEVLLASGEVVPAEKVRVGDVLMGDDGTPRHVLSISQGRGPLYKIIPRKGKPWICNDAHVMSLRYTGPRSRPQRVQVAGVRKSVLTVPRIPVRIKNEIIDVPLTKILEKKSRIGRWNLFRVPVEWPENEQSSKLSVDDFYFCGLWIGDGASGKHHGIELCNLDTEILHWIRGYACSKQLEYREHFDSRRIGTRSIWLKATRRDQYLGVCKNIHPLSPLLMEFGRGRGVANKTIPLWALRASRNKRMALLAGLLDADGSLRFGGFDISQKSKAVADSICFLARSLGFWSEVKVVRKGCQTGVFGTYYRQHISGDTSEIPTRVERKRAAVRKQIKDVCSVGWKAEPFGIGDYYGFTLDGNGRFLLGDFTVTHNTETAKAFTEYLWGGGLTMLYMNEYQRADDVDDLVMAIKRGVSTNATGRTFLFDEIEKAHRGVIDVFISLLDEGQITDSDGSRISVGNAYTVFTSNIGAARWGAMERTPYSRMESFAFEQARKVLRPELFNRLTETIVFRPLSQTVQIDILKGMLGKKLTHLEPRLGKRPLFVDDRANAHLLRKCFTATEGARRLRQEMDRQINLAALPWMLQKQPPEEGRFCYDAKSDQLVLR